MTGYCYNVIVVSNQNQKYHRQSSLEVECAPLEQSSELRASECTPDHVNVWAVATLLHHEAVAMLRNTCVAISDTVKSWAIVCSL